jgi:putative intracellular protease/amidase
LSHGSLDDYIAEQCARTPGPPMSLTSADQVRAAKAFDADVGRLLTAQLASGDPLFIVCHGSASMLATRIHGVSPFKGYRVTGFTNKEEEAVGLASRVTWLLETDLKEKIGVNCSCGEIWKPYMVEDRNLVTGQNPASAAVLAKRLLQVLG